MGEGPQSSNNRRFYVIALIASIFFVGYSFLLASKSVAGFPAAYMNNARWPWLGDKPFGEDGFYMLTVADNFARTGHLIYTYDMPATGIQPLATFIFAGVAFLSNHLGGDRWTLIRAVILLTALQVVLCAWLVAYIAASLVPAERRHLVFVLAYLMFLFDFSIFRLFTYGLETGLYLITAACCMIVWRKLVKHKAANGIALWTDIALLGITGGVAGLARIDFGLIFIFLLSFLLIQRLGTLLQALTAGLTALVITSPWFFFVHSVSGAWLPSSGKAESRWMRITETDRYPPMARALAAHLFPWAFANGGTWQTDIFALVNLALFIAILVRTRSMWKRPKVFREIYDIFAPWIAGMAVFTMVYLLLFWSNHFYSRYLAPLVLITIPLLAIGLSALQRVQRRIGLVLAGLMVMFSLWDGLTLHRGKMGNSFLISAGYIQTYFPNVRVGSFQSGTVGFFNRNVMNLDGKLNQGALKASETGRLPEFIDAEKIDVLIDWPGYLAYLPADYLEREWQPCPVAMPVVVETCLIRKTSR